MLMSIFSCLSADPYLFINYKDKKGNSSDAEACQTPTF